MNKEDSQRVLLLVITYLLVFIFTNGLEEAVSIPAPIVIP